MATELASSDQIETTLGGRLCRRRFIISRLCLQYAALKKIWG